MILTGLKNTFEIIDHKALLEKIEYIHKFFR